MPFILNSMVPACGQRPRDSTFRRWHMDYYRLNRLNPVLSTAPATE